MGQGEGILGEALRECYAYACSGEADRFVEAGCSCEPLLSFAKSQAVAHGIEPDVCEGLVWLKLRKLGEKLQAEPAYFKAKCKTPSSFRGFLSGCIINCIRDERRKDARQHKIIIEYANIKKYNDCISKNSGHSYNLDSPRVVQELVARLASETRDLLLECLSAVRECLPILDDDLEKRPGRKNALQAVVHKYRKWADATDDILSMFPETPGESLTDAQLQASDDLPRGR
jgi:hypothetical protein